MPPLLQRDQLLPPSQNACVLRADDPYTPQRFLAELAACTHTSKQHCRVAVLRSERIAKYPVAALSLRYTTARVAILPSEGAWPAEHIWI